MSYVKKINGYVIKDEEGREKIQTLENETTSNVKIIVPKNIEGQDAGDCTLIKAYGKSILIDTHRIGAYTDIKNFLDRNEIESLDYVILTHYHDDHAGNIVNLINDNYINENTYVYLPAYSSLIEESESALSYYNNVNSAIVSNNIPHTIPNEEDYLEIEDFKITFYNCETSIFTEMGVTNYNDCSTVCLIEYGDEKALFTGDITDKPFKRFINEEMFNYKINIYKLEHHGNNINDESTQFLQQITPDLAIHETTSYSIEIGRNSRSSGLAYMMMNNIPIYSQYNNFNDLIIDMYKNKYSVKQGKQNYSQAGYGIVNTFYVDGSTNNTIQNGSSDYPFKSLAQALGKINKIEYARNIINCKAGTYELQTKQYVSGADITINGVSGNIPAVVIKGEMLFYNCNVTLNNLTITNEDNYDGLDFQASNVVVNKCNIYAPNNTLSTKNGISSFKSKLIVRDSTISYYTNAISNQYDITYVNTVTFSNCTTALNENRSMYSIFNPTYTSVTNNIAGTNYVNIENIPKSEVIFNTSTPTTAETTITLTKDFSRYNKLIINLGNVSDGTWESVLINCYDNDYFRNSQKFVVKTSTGKFVVSTSSNKILTIDSNDGNTQNIRQIIGLNN